MRATLAFVASAALLEGASGHFSFVDIRSQIACDFYAGDGPDFIPNWLSSPIVMGASFSQWWMHGQVNCQPRAIGSFALPANGMTDILMSSRVALVSPPYSAARSIFDLFGLPILYEPEPSFQPPNPDYVLTAAEWGSGPDSRGNTLDGYHNIHAYNRTDTSGCALAIAYKSNAIDVLPKDFVIFSVVHDCPKRQREPIHVPNLPACPNGKCICAWFWIPKNSGTKNFYMTPFVCHVTNANTNASPIDFEYAIPPRRCLDPKKCNFGPRNPLYWLGNGNEINMPENILQSPHYSIRYGFREGAQKDIFINTNPRRHVSVQVPVEQKCTSTTRSRIVQPAGFPILTNLTSPTCRCIAMRLTNGEIRIYDNNNLVSTVNIGGVVYVFDLVNRTSFKANRTYFPLSVGPYRMDLNDKCYLYVTDGKGVVVWESMFNGDKAAQYVVNTFTGMAADPSEWPVDGTIYTQPPTTKPTPTLKPTTSQPTTRKPSDKPTTKAPTANPSLMPTSSKPTTSRPTTKPTQLPSSKPTTKAPTGKPVTHAPTARPTTTAPSMTLPTSLPTSSPTPEPTMTGPTINELVVSTTTSIFNPTSGPLMTSEPTMSSEPTASSRPNTLHENIFN